MSNLVCPICGNPTRVYMGNARKDRLCGKHADEFKAGDLLFCEDCNTWHYQGKPCSCSSCPICGNPTRTYMGNPRKDGLCGKHADELKAGTLQYCEDCNTWHYQDQPCKCKPKKKVYVRTVPGNGFCIVCGKQAAEGLLCTDCFNEMIAYLETIDARMKPYELREYYYNVKSSIIRMVGLEKTMSNCNKLIAIADVLRLAHNDLSLINQVERDITQSIESKKKKKEQQESEYLHTKDTQREEVIRTKDGHRVKSSMEGRIDDILYDLRIVHCYEKDVDTDLGEQTVKSDWFIPVHSDRQGIFIEYWGMRTQQYLANKERKQSVYRQKNIPLIEIEKEEPDDIQTLTSKLRKEINMLAKERFGLTENLIK